MSLSEPGSAATDSTVNSQTPRTKINPPLFKLKLLDSLKNNNYEQLKETAQSIESSSNQYELQQIKDSILNLAVQVAPIRFIESLLSGNSTNEFDIDINHQDSDGNTPLHLVALNNRLDVAQLLLKNPEINDTILNNDNKQAIELTNDLNMVALMQNERALYIEIIATKFRKAFTTHDFATLDDILLQPRNFELLDINGYDPETGDTVLHEFIKKNDLGMVKWILSHGGDPFKRDKRGRLPLDLVPKSSEILKQIIKDASQDQSVIELSNKASTGIQAPTYKGYLRKWTNYASGYKLRWFILDANGILSYYKSQDDTNNACRGSLNMKSAILHLDSSEALKFEIISKSGDRWHLKGNHPVETNRWVWSLQGSIRFAKDRERSMKLALEQADSRRASVENNVKPQPRIVSGSILSKEPDAKSTKDSSKISTPLKNTTSSEHPEHAQVSDDEDDDDDDEEEDEHYNSDGIREDHGDGLGPYSQEISVLKNRFSIELKFIQDLLVNLQVSGGADESVNILLKGAESLIQGFDNYNNLVSKRDEKLLKKLKKQQDINELWINSIREMENELITKSTEIETFELERKQIKKALTRRQTGSAPVPSVSALSIETVGDSKENEDSVEDNDKIVDATSPITEIEPTPEDEISRIFQSNDDSDDEFFDADDFEEDDDEQAADVLTLRSSHTFNKAYEIDDGSDYQYATELQQSKYQLIKDEGSFKGYDDPVRTELGLKIDERPSISLWGILKSMIGKDITKITLPVSFNEPTSLLQRCAEDLEYTYLLDQASTFEDSTLRLLYIAAFAATPYSSTINRVAKPFNPLLGETFEYSRPDHGFRYFTEQVSHHPPVSAIITESPKWDYYGETPVTSGFNGRSFDVTPTATWYLTMRPDNSEEEEVYSWKKITTSVIGIMVGSPSIDNYGEMIITNHKTGDKAVLNFKQRGWTGKNAYELSGVISDGEGNKRWAIGGRWDSKIYGKRIIQNEIQIDHASTRVETAPNEDGVKFLMWQATPRPIALFNLTSFAISLNALPPHLVEWLCSSDSRLRPDQRAMEDGKYEEASELKSGVEIKQRATRKQREENGEVYKPAFFEREIHPLNGEEYWKFTGRYWKERNTKTLPKSEIFDV